MEISSEKVREYARRIQISRMRVLCNNGFYGLLLMHMKISISDEHETAWSDMGERIYFNPEFLEKVTDSELDYALMHVVMHVVLHHLNRKGDFKDEYYYRAADIVANSNIFMSTGGKNENAITLRDYGGVQPHQAPDGKEGWEYSVEELYKILAITEVNKVKGKGESDGNEDGENCENAEKSDNKSGEYDNGTEDNIDDQNGGGANSWDYHLDSTSLGERDFFEEEKWKSRIQNAVRAIEIQDSQKTRGVIPAFAQRVVQELQKPQVDWRTILDEFVQEEINDYSFCPPDRRFDDCPFFLPDFNEKDVKVENILFMVDTSGSMSDKEITACYSEIKGAIDQYNGRLAGWLGFFDAVVVEPKPFIDEDEFIAIRPEGGGGTDFTIIFDYVRDNMSDEPPVSIVILTDGYAPFPLEEATMQIPVLWIINNDEITPPWGKVARIHIENEQ